MPWGNYSGRLLSEQRTTGWRNQYYHNCRSASTVQLTKSNKWCPENGGLLATLKSLKLWTKLVCNRLSRISSGAVTTIARWQSCAWTDCECVNSTAAGSSGYEFQDLKRLRSLKTRGGSVKGNELQIQGLSGSREHCALGLQGVEKLISSKMMLEGSNRRIHAVHRHACMVGTELFHSRGHVTCYFSW